MVNIVISWYRDGETSSSGVQYFRTKDKKRVAVHDDLTNRMADAQNIRSMRPIEWQTLITFYASDQ
jgi:hypothetical protein